jgi:hypothetical protein
MKYFKQTSLGISVISNSAVVRHIAQETGRQHPISAINTWSDAEIAVFDLYRDFVNNKPSLDKYQDANPDELTLVDGQVVQNYTVLDWSLDRLPSVKIDLLGDIDRIAETQRAKYVTAIWGQETIYLEKEAEAKSWLADNTASTPYLTAESAATGVAIADLANTVIANSEAWRQLSIHMETNRMKLKSQVNNATTWDDLRTIDVNDGWEIV